MPSTLVTFLGRVPRDQHGSYRPTVYRFPDGSDCAPVAFFGWELVRRQRPARLVVLGTAGSMWDHLFEGDHDFGAEAEEERLALAAAVETQTVTAAQLAPLEALLAQRLGCAVSLRLIPYCRDEAEQIGLLQCMAAAIGERETVQLDVTHGFRHLPMLALLSALHLRSTRAVQIERIWYASYDPDARASTVHDLNGLLHLADWIGALATYDKDGDYGVFAPLLAADGLTQQQTAHLERAAFYERTTNPRDAAKELANFDKVLAGGLPGSGALFAEALRVRTRWPKGRSLAAQQKELARQNLARGDYIRAAIYAFEAQVTLLMPKQASPADYKAREFAQKEHEAALRSEPTPAGRDYWLLKNLRNTLAHGNEPSDARIPGLLADEARLRRELERLIRELAD